MRPITNSQKLFKGALILTAAAMLTKILSAFYRIPFQNIVGDIGFYIYQQVYPFYGIMLVLATQGFPVVISKLYKEQTMEGNERNGVSVLFLSFLFLSLLGLSLFLFFFIGAGWIAKVMGDENLSPLFRIIAIPFLFFPFTSVFRGAFQGEENMVPTAVSQVAEQFVRVITILTLSSLLIHYGYSLYDAGAGAVFGSVTGGFIGLLTLVFFFLKANAHQRVKISHFRPIIRNIRPVMKTLLIEGFAISISGMVLILMQLADALNLYNLLVSSGISEEEAKQLKGVFDRGQPLIQLGTVVATSMALSLVPAISGKKSKNLIIDDVRFSLKVSCMIGAAAAIGLFSIIEPTNAMLFENKEGSYPLALLSLTILPGSILITIIGILQGLNHSIFPAFMIVTGFGLKYVLNISFIPDYGIVGAAIATVITLTIILILLIIKLRNVLAIRILSAGFLGKVIVATGVMALFLHLYLKGTNGLYLYFVSARLGASIQAMTAVVLGAILYLVVVLKLKLLEESDLLMLPFGSKLLFLLPKR